ncbi:NUDIX hydrolase [Larkinella rosea]|uniref:GDP-mannose pyrophosphatase n=1 Tax=Larkinella rosea TaxID=2025312 RepID=A0A3P1C3R0_9BACT|nr:NUDIX hydrolase [Larkinella rosea]RRB07733.1 NUDIX hydrolase [Larkinella rosea]
MHMKKELLADAPKFRFWQQQAETNGLVINHIHEFYVRHRHNGEVLFAMLEVDANTPEGDKIPPALFLKGHAVSVLVCLIDQDTKEKYVVLVRQRRICDGSHTYEHPAGMVDTTDDPQEVAAREVGEEIGLALKPEELTRLNNRLLFPSTGTSDEAMHYFYVEREMPRQQILDFHHKDMGVASEFERITTAVTTLPEAHKLITNINGLLIHFLYLNAVGDYETMKLL